MPMFDPQTEQLRQNLAQQMTHTNTQQPGRYTVQSMWPEIEKAMWELSPGVGDWIGWDRGANNLYQAGKQIAGGDISGAKRLPDAIMDMAGAIPGIGDIATGIKGIGTMLPAMAGMAKMDDIIARQRLAEGLRAAIRDPETGKLYIAGTHQAAIEKAPAWDADPNPGTWGRLSYEWDQATDNVGFVNKDGKFISRDEAERQMGVSTVEDVRDLLWGRYRR